MELRRPDSHAEPPPPRHGGLQDEDPRGGGHATRQAEAPAREHLIQGRKHSRLLQRHAGHCQQSPAQGEGREEEVKGIMETNDGFLFEYITK